MNARVVRSRRIKGPVKIKSIESRGRFSGYPRRDNKLNKGWIACAKAEWNVIIFMAYRDRSIVRKSFPNRKSCWTNFPVYYPALSTFCRMVRRLKLRREKRTVWSVISSLHFFSGIAPVASFVCTSCFSFDFFFVFFYSDCSFELNDRRDETG